MAVSNSDYLKSYHQQIGNVGSPSINSDFYLQIEGYESLSLQTKQAPWPVLSSAGEIEVSGPLGTVRAEPQQAKVYNQGPISFHEDASGSVDSTLLAILSGGGKFNAKIYEGTPENFTLAKRIYDCFIVLDAPDRDWENRAQVLDFTGTLHYHYFGETIPGNVNSL